MVARGDGSDLLPRAPAVDALVVVQLSEDVVELLFYVAALGYRRGGFAGNEEAQPAGQVVSP